MLFRGRLHHLHKDLFGDVYPALPALKELLLAALLLIKELVLTLDVAAIEIARHILTQRRERAGSNDASSRFRLYLRYEKLLREKSV